MKETPKPPKSEKETVKKTETKKLTLAENFHAGL